MADELEIPKLKTIPLHLHSSIVFVTSLDNTSNIRHSLDERGNISNVEANSMGSRHAIHSKIG